MAMTGSGMKSLVKSKIEALTAESGGGNIQFVRDDILEALCEGIVEYIQAHAVVPAAGTVNTGPGAGGAVTTTGTVT